MQRTGKYEKLHNVTKKWNESPNAQTYAPQKEDKKVSIYDFDISQVIYPSENYVSLKTMIRPKKWYSVAGTFM
jgi:hypothetical protein